MKATNDLKPKMVVERFTAKGTDPRTNFKAIGHCFFNNDFKNQTVDWEFDNRIND